MEVQSSVPQQALQAPQQSPAVANHAAAAAAAATAAHGGGVNGVGPRRSSLSVSGRRPSVSLSDQSLHHHHPQHHAPGEDTGMMDAWSAHCAYHNPTNQRCVH
jgi:hypothetical protein